MLKRYDPKEAYSYLPCSLVAMYQVRDLLRLKIEPVSPLTNKEGYATLQAVNKAIKQSFKCKRYVYIAKNKRYTLNDFKENGLFIVCVLGHYLVVENKKYYSFFNNDNDEIVAFWEIEKWKSK